MYIKQKGFTLVELVISMFMLSAFLSIIYTATSGISDNITRERNETFPKEMVNMFKEHYILNTYEVDSNSGSSYLAENISIENNSLSTNVSESLNEMIDTVSYSNATFRDGYNQPMLIMVSELLTQEYEGVLIPYRVFSIVSTAGIDVMEKSTFKSTMDVSTGIVNAHPEESVVTVNTFQEQLEKFKRTKDKVRKIAKSYSLYYWSRHNLGIGDISVDYFASSNSGRWDRDSLNKTVKKTCDSGSPDVVNSHNTPGVDVSYINFTNALGLSDDFAKTDWGEPIYITNCGVINNVLSGGEIKSIRPRNPEQTGVNRNIQPFNAVIGFTLPNGESYYESISSRT